MKPISKMTAAFGAAILTASFLTGCNDSDQDETPVVKNFSLQLLHFADVDGGGTAAMSNVDQFSALVSHFRSLDPKNTLLISGGDNYIPGPIFEASRDKRLNDLIGKAGPGRAEIAIQNHLGVQASVVGNHDLDSGPEGFAGIIAPDAEYKGAQWPYLSVNIDFKTEASTAKLVQDKTAEASTLPAGSLARSTIVTVNGEKIGIVGASTPTLSSITSTGKLEITPKNFTEDSAGFDAFAQLIQVEVDQLSKMGINKIILAAHMQRISVEKALATRLKNVDIIIAGGSNTLLADENDTLRPGDTKADTYPLQFKSKSGEPVLLVNTNGDYTYLGRLVVEFDKNGVIQTNRLDSKLNGAWAATDDMVAKLKAKPMPEVVAIATKVREILKEQDGTAYGITQVFLEGRRAEIRSRETNLGNLSADANLWYAQQMDSENPALISVKNGGGIRSHIGQILVPPGSANSVQLSPPAANSFGKPAGGISQLDIQTAFAFNNGLAAVDMTAAEIRDLIEELVKGNFGHTAGLKVQFDRSKAARADGDLNQGLSSSGQQVVNMQVCLGDWNAGLCGKGWQDLVVKGVTQDTQRSYRVVALDFLNACAAPETSPYFKPNCGSSWPFKGMMNANFVSFKDDQFKAKDPSKASFSITGGEQDALAEYLQVFHPDQSKAYKVMRLVNERMINSTPK